MPSDEAELMARYVSGERGAFDALYQRVGPPIFRYLMRMARDRALAEDLLQLTFLKVHRARSAYVVGAAPMPWLYAIAHRTFLDEARRRKRAKVRLTSGDALPEQPANLQGKDIRHASRPVDAERLGQVHAAMEKLPANQRQAITLIKIEGKTIAEAAEIAGTSKGAMKLRAHRAYVAIRVQLAGETSP